MPVQLPFQIREERRIACGSLQAVKENSPYECIWFVSFCVWHWLVCSPKGSHTPQHTLNLFLSPQTTAVTAVQVVLHIMHVTGKLCQSICCKFADRAGLTVLKTPIFAALRVRGLAAPAKEKEA